VACKQRAGRHLFSKQDNKGHGGGNKRAFDGGLCKPPRRDFRVVIGGIHPNKASEEIDEPQSCCEDECDGVHLRRKCRTIFLIEKIHIITFLLKTKS